VDHQGWHVHDYLDLLLPDVETEPWTSHFRVDGPAADELRAALRSTECSETTITRVVKATGVPTLLADAALGTLDIAGVAGAQTFEPGTLWGSFKQIIREEMTDSEEMRRLKSTADDAVREKFTRASRYPAWAGFVVRWEERRRRRSLGYLALNAAAAVILAVRIALHLDAGTEFGSVLWMVVSLLLLVFDVVRPRRVPPGRSADSNDNGGSPSGG
jgi:hypothetical protein